MRRQIQVLVVELNNVRFEVFTAVSMKMAAFCVVALMSRPDDGGSKHL
jgi:hypothetical protein